MSGTVAAGFITLSPSRVMVDENQYAEFTCTLTCGFNTHSPVIVWLVGHYDQFLVDGQTESFIAASGLQVEVQKLKGCGTHRESVERLRINASSADQFNRTAVQCFVPPLPENVTRQYSGLSVMLIRAAERG